MSGEGESLLDFYRSQQSEDFPTQRPTSRSRDDDASPKTLSLFFASLCVIDLFGVFPIVALPRSIILCGT